MCYESTVERSALVAEDRKPPESPSAVVASVPEPSEDAKAAAGRQRLSATEFWDIIDPAPAGA